MTGPVKTGQHIEILAHSSAPSRAQDDECYRMLARAYVAFVPAARITLPDEHDGVGVRSTRWEHQAAQNEDLSETDFAPSQESSNPPRKKRYQTRSSRRASRRYSSSRGMREADALVHEHDGPLNEAISHDPLSRPQRPPLGKAAITALSTPTTSSVSPSVATNGAGLGGGQQSILSHDTTTPSPPASTVCADNPPAHCNLWSHGTQKRSPEGLGLASASEAHDGRGGRLQGPPRAQLTVETLASAQMHVSSSIPLIPSSLPDDITDAVRAAQQASSAFLFELRARPAHGQDAGTMSPGLGLPTPRMPAVSVDGDGEAGIDSFEHLEIHPPSLDVSMASLPRSFVTPGLLKLAEKLDLAERYRPHHQSRLIQSHERGYWLLDCSAWPPELKRRSWSFLSAYVGHGRAGWGVWAQRDTTGTALRIYCWGELVGYIYLLLYLVSERKIKCTDPQWIDAEGKVVVSMTAVLG